MGQMRVRRTGPWVKISCPFSWVQFNSDSGSKLGQTRCARTHANSASSSIAPEATARPTSTTSSLAQSSRIPLTSRVELIYIERGSPGRKLFGLFSYSPKLRLSCSQVLWYNLNTKLSNKSEVIKENLDETVFMFALFKRRKFDKRRN